MQRLWTPWRLAYVSGGGGGERKGVPAELSGWPGTGDRGCVFCNLIASVRWAIEAGTKREDAEEAALLLSQGETCFVCLNRYPYSTGHVLIVPYAHEASLAELPETTTAELMGTVVRVEAAIRRAYHPDGLNIGMNLGEAGGAGVADHLHMHELPRWRGDTNFMTVTADTRVLPEDLAVTWRRLRAALTDVQP